MNSTSSNSNPSNIAPTITISEEKTTTFFDDGSVKEADFGSKPPKDDLEVRLQDIRDFLGKPFFALPSFTTNNWTTAQIANTQLFAIDPRVYLTKTGSNVLWYNKLQGFNLMRATAVLRVVINANPFQQGRLLLHFLPNYSSRSVLVGAGAKDKNIDLTTKSMQPHVELDCRETTCIMKVPYIAPTSWTTIENGPTISWGTFFLSVLSPLRTGSGGDTSVTYSAYLSFEDIELSAPLVPQAGKFKTSRGPVAAKEADAMGMGSISYALKQTAKAASTMATIPSFAAIAGPVSWAADAMSGVASFFGFSKPDSRVVPSITGRCMQRYAATSDGVDTSMPLALRSDNSIDLSTDYSLVDDDEMSLRYLVSIPAVVPFGGANGFVWLETDFGLLTSGNIGPNMFRTTIQTVNAVNLTYNTGPPMAYLAPRFRFWRGSIVAHFKFIKTDFHSGRLQFVWTPTVGTPAVLSTIATSVFSLREIVDIRENSEVSITLPYMHGTDWLTTQETSGHLSISIINQLKSPETASNAVECVMWFCGGPDFQFAGPGVSSPPLNPRPLVLQSGFGSCADECAGNSQSPSCDISQVSRTMGEAVTSVRQLTSRFNQVFVKTFVNSNGMQYWPWHVSAVAQDAVTGALISPNPGGDIFSYIAPMYAFYRGSMRVMVKTEDGISVTSPANPGLIAAVNPCWYDQPSQAILSAGPPLLGATAVTAWQSPYPGGTEAVGATGIGLTDSGVGIHSFSVPYYSQCRVSFVRPYTTDTLGTGLPFEGITQSRTMLAINGKGAFVNSSLYRATGEDFVFSYFTGCPPWAV